MKIIHLTTHIGHGGDWTIIRSLMGIFKAKGHQVMIGGCRASLTEFNAVEMPLNQGVKGFLQSLAKFKDIPRDAEILHAHSPISLLLATTLKYLHCRSAKIIFTYHWKTYDSKIKKHLKRYIFNLADIIHSYSTDIHIFLGKEYNIDNFKNHLAYVGCDSSFLYSKDLIEKEENKLNYKRSKSNNIILLFVGRLSIEKNISLIFQYLKNKQANNIELLIAGEGALKDELKQECKKLNIEDRVQFLGQVENIQQVYSVADLLILPSSSMETFGMVVIEAAFCGVPTLRSNLPGANDQIMHGENGFIFPIEQSEKMFDILDQVLQDRSQLQVIGQKAQEHALAYFTLEKMYDRLLKLYKICL